ncbi:MAG: hypothetical protein GEV05_30210 [Betaproteobacteria bacterium]|nr:hypothetical protein [Betaproteobacteria bacterium]
MDESDLHTSFGIFYPTGWIVVAFPERAFAEQVQRDVFTGGYDEADCKLIRGDEVIPSVQAQLDGSGWLAKLGMADEMIGRHLDAAKRGSTFLLIHALSDAEAERAMKVVRRVPFDLAHRYHRFAIEEIK